MFGQRSPQDAVSSSNLTLAAILSANNSGTLGLVGGLAVTMEGFHLLAEVNVSVSTVESTNSSGRGAGAWVAVGLEFGMIILRGARFCVTGAPSLARCAGGLVAVQLSSDTMTDVAVSLVGVLVNGSANGTSRFPIVADNVKTVHAGLAWPPYRRLHGICCIP